MLDKTQPQQLGLFQTFLPEDDPDDKFSNTIEFYDAIPKYFSNPRLMDTMRKDGIYLPRLERELAPRRGVQGNDTSCPPHGSSWRG